MQYINQTMRRGLNMRDIWPDNDMTAVVLHAPNDLRVEKVPMPQAAAGQLLLQVHACGICGSDLRYLAGENPWAKHTLGFEPANPPDMILGHEVAGTVIENGRTRRVGVLSFRTCGHCHYCRTGRANLCPETAHLGHGAGWEGQNAGGMAEYCPVWTEHLFDLPDWLSFEEATFLDGLGVAVHAVRCAGTISGQPVLVQGAGPIGLSIAQVAMAWGAEPVAITDIYDAALECARKLKLGPCLNVAGADDREVGADLARASGETGFVAVFDTTGSLEAQAQGLAALDRGGTMIAMAGIADGLTLTQASLAGERRLMTASNNFPDDFATGLELLVTGQVQVKPMITHIYSLQDAVQAFGTASNKQKTDAIKVVLIP
ncbi:MAG: alcohol dehydrogenase catalytic domain-containing protein [candidate division WS1 bacterium]|jgi:2-desacetyl-2-hydroxyethyl bacteriochlorophyllide A dehydrogenase|nr:alcohol dehydrogenase catalytic domain-containing protein [candidate division WS1 bacterium]